VKYRGQEGSPREEGATPKTARRARKHGGTRRRREFERRSDRRGGRDDKAARQRLLVARTAEEWQKPRRCEEYEYDDGSDSARARRERCHDLVPRPRSNERRSQEYAFGRTYSGRVLTARRC
jgi:hypothetical protein